MSLIFKRDKFTNISLEFPRLKIMLCNDFVDENTQSTVEGQAGFAAERSKLTSLRPEAEALLKSESTGKVKGVIVTMKGAPNAQPGYDFYSRYFAPWYGVLEDPVCGSAHTVLAGYWSEKLNKKKMLAYQCSSRGGELELELRDDGRLNISGRAQIILQGTLKI